MEHKSYKFDDERGNNFNITVNHYHAVAPRSPMQNIGDMIAQTIMTRAICDALAPREESPERLLPRNSVLIGNGAIGNGTVEQIEYEIHDDIKDYTFEILSMSEMNDIMIMKIKFDYPIDFSEFTKNFYDISENVKKKLSVINSKNHQFTFEFDMKDMGKIVCACINNNFYTNLIKKYGNGKDRVYFKREIAEKLNVPFLPILSGIDFIVDTESLFKIKFESIDSKYHISKEGEIDGNKYL
jgi:hypothetical protein